MARPSQLAGLGTEGTFEKVSIVRPASCGPLGQRKRAFLHSTHPELGGARTFLPEVALSSLPSKAKGVPIPRSGEFIVESFFVGEASTKDTQ